MKNNLPLGATGRAPRSITLDLTDPISHAKRSITLDLNQPLAARLDTIVDEGFGSSLCDALEAEAAKPDALLFVWCLLIPLEIHERRYLKAALRGRTLIERDALPDLLRVSVALAHHYAGLPGEAYELLVEDHRPFDEFQLACCAARMGKHSVALEHLIKATATSETNRVRALLDEDFDPLWEHFDTGAANFQECALLASPGMAHCFGPVPPYDGSLDYLDHFDFARLPERLRPAVKARFALSIYAPRRPGDRSYDDALSTELFHFRITEGVNRRLRATAAWDMAKRALLVLAEAETCAGAGNMMHARWHLSEIVRNFPNAAGDISGHCVNPGLRRLADEFGAVENLRPRFTCDAAGAYEAGDFGSLAEVLKSCPPPLLSLGMIQIYHGHLAMSVGDTENAVHAYLAAAISWPNDAAPFHNAANQLAELGRWDEAATGVARAPATFHEIEVCRATELMIATRNRKSDASTATY